MQTAKRTIKAVIAGSGSLPERVISRLEELQADFFVVSIEGFGPEKYPQFAIGEVGRILETIKEKKATEIIFCGAVKRPSFRSLKLDSVGKTWLRKLGVRAFLGDDALLKGLRKLLKLEGLEIVSPQEILSTLLTPRGVLTDAKPSESDMRDIARGIFVLNATSKADIGQAVVVQDGIVLAIEAAEGTDSMLERATSLKPSTEKGGVFVKTSKEGQDQALDLPTIGTHTVEMVARSGFAGIALGAKASQIVDFEDTVSLANKKGLFLLGF